MLKVKIFVILLLVICNVNLAKSQISEEINLAKQALINLKNKDYSKACFYFDVGLKDLMPDTIVQKIWENLLIKYGKYIHDIEVTSKNIGTNNSISIVSKFEKSDIINYFFNL